MVEVPRLALGVFQPEASVEPVASALLEILHQADVGTQLFHSRSQFQICSGDSFPHRKRPRHLDSWLMSADFARWALWHGSRASDLAVVVGRYGIPAPTPNRPAGGTLDRLCEYLDLPKVVIVDVSQTQRCQLPALPADTVAVVLDRVSNCDEAAFWQTCLESMFGVPVLGAMPVCSAEREQLLNSPANAADIRGRASKALASQFVHHLRLGELLNLAQLGPFFLPQFPTHYTERRPTRLNVAIAFDEAFNCYFPDTLDALELHGARLCDFSPLKSDRLPPNTHLVLFGCGHPELMTRPLAMNACLKQALHDYARQGGRIYAEGGGLAYLCEALQIGDQCFPMAGLLPAVARRVEQPALPVSMMLQQACWLGEAKTWIRGYLNSMWHLEPTGPLIDYTVSTEHPLSVVGTQNVIGSRLHLHFFAQPEILQSLLTPHAVG